MSLDADACYRAIAGRDRRFEGRFVVAVRTTGVYCRPGCPAPLPKQKNVEFYACAAAAEDAGFRACLRCRPESGPGTPAWAGTSATVARALRLISEGALDDAGIDELAERLGVGSRHLRRLFDEHLGASPVAIARTRRAHFARRLLGETSLPIAEIALAAGFASVRRFNDVMRATFHASPTALRKTRSGPEANDRREVRLRLPYRATLDWSATLAYLRARAIPGVESVTEDAYERTVRTRSGDAATILILHPRASETEGELVLAWRGPVGADLMDAASRARKLFDLDADPSAIADHLGSDRAMKGAAARIRRGLRVPGAWDPFELGVRAIVGQQVTVAHATRLAGSIARTFGDAIASPRDERLTHLFPPPATLANARIEDVGMPRARAEAIRSFARAWQAEDGPSRLSRGLDDSVARMIELPGIGPWTAHYVAMRALGEPDAFPETDLALRRVWSKVGEGDLAERAERWRPWRAYAAMALWAIDASESKQDDERSAR